MEKIVIVVWDDHRSDTGVFPFRNIERAKKWAMKQAISMAEDHPDWVDDSEKFGDELYRVSYGESDFLWIVERKIDNG